MLASSADRRSANGRRVLQATLAPELIEAAFDPERAAHADVALEALAVVTDLLDDVVGPLVVDAEPLPHAGGDTEDALDARVLALQHLLNVLRRDLVLLGLQHGEKRPAHDVGELVVAMAHDRSQGLLRDDLRQD